MKTLVLGGSRFIGLHLVRELASYDHQVTVLNRGQTKVELPRGVQRIYADRQDVAAMKKALGGTAFDWVFDVSAYTPQEIQTAVDLLDGRVGRYVFTSTTSVFSIFSILPATEEFPMVDQPGALLPPQPNTREYAVNKTACERLLADRWQKDRFPYTVLRPPAVYGPDNYSINREFGTFARLRRGRKLLVPGNGLTTIQFTHVDDMVRAYHLAPQTGASLAQTYTLAAHEAITYVGYYRLLAEIVGVEPQLVFVPYERIKGTRPSWCPFEWERLHLESGEKAYSQLGWSPFYNLRQGMGMTYQWYLRSGLDDGPWDFSDEDKLLAELRA
ncbi:MAG: NAD-dependent epimerase/dehydratase family protein [Chloroflexi bacterium]|nr:NAD-dependent epimerase/dehydratase family protein [Chloroflexota bacterium]